jgi:hypothetical protein
MLWIGVCHITMPILKIIYAIIGPVWLDKWVFIYAILLSMHWVLFKGECVISYVYKKMKDASYEMGTTKELQDINDVLLYMEEQYGISYQTSHGLMNALNIVALLVLFMRFGLLGSVKPVWIVWLTIAIIYTYNALVRFHVTTRMTDNVYVICLVAIVVKVLSSN